MNAPEIVTALAPVVEALAALQVPYLIGGSVASSAHGLPRATLDVDLVADLKQSHVRPLVERLEAAYYIDEDMIRQAIRTRSSFNLIHLDTALKIDVFLLKPRAYDLTAFHRRYQGALVDALEATSYYLASPEDVILNKLEWYRKGGGVSERQWNDVIGVMKVQGKRLDREYLEHWAQELGVGDLLTKALVETGLNEER